MLFDRTVLYSGESQYGKYKIIDMPYNGRPARVLYGEDNSPQSGAARDDEPELLFDYNQRFIELIMSHNPKRLLVIGGGAFMLPIAAFHRFPKLTIDVVEVDELLVELSYNYFDLPRDKRMRVHVADGLAFATNSKEKYDMIIIDAFSGYTIPHHLVDRNALLQYRRHLSRKGVVAINFISEYKQSRPRLAHELLATFDEVFSYVSIYQADSTYYQGEEQNLLLTASAYPLQFDYLQTVELERY